MQASDQQTPLPNSGNLPGQASQSALSDSQEAINLVHKMNMPALSSTNNQINNSFGLAVQGQTIKKQKQSPEDIETINKLEKLRKIYPEVIFKNTKLK